eukprot:2847097-Rhodomonas_salina.2
MQDTRCVTHVMLNTTCARATRWLEQRKPRTCTQRRCERCFRNDVAHACYACPISVAICCKIKRQTAAILAQTVRRSWVFVFDFAGKGGKNSTRSSRNAIA